jgi:hypothetical protein
MRIIGFIPRDRENEDARDAVDDELDALRKVWHARQLAEAIEADQILKEAHEALFKQVRRYADRLELIDPDGYNAAEEIGKVVLTLSYAENAQERLDALTSEARRLMLAVAEAKRSTDDEPLAECGRTSRWVRSLIHGLLGALCGLACGLFVEGMLF